jgi:tRNA nucleotidyltransferase (CCA-adding enzyme)
MQKNLQNGKKILKKLHDAGYEAFFVGGFVRDSLLNLPTKDIDITTNATPLEVKDLFNKVISTGEKYGTVSVMIDHTAFEVTTYRSEQSYHDHRRPSRIDFAKTLKEDVSRRDFTINQLIMDIDGDIIDYHQGLTDLNHKIIRTINDPNDRFKEDALRIMRAFRFAAKLGFTIEEETLKAIEKNRGLLNEIAIERIQDELIKLFDEPYKVNAIKAMQSSQVLKTLFQSYEAFDILTQPIPYDHTIALAVLTIEGEPIETRFKLSKKLVQTCKQLARIHTISKETGFTNQLLFTEGLEASLKANQLNRLYGFYEDDEQLKKAYEALPIKAVCELAFKGEHIIKTFDLKNRSHIGFIIDALILKVINHEVANEFNALKEAAYEIKNELEKSDYYE